MVGSFFVDEINPGGEVRRFSVTSRTGDKNQPLIHARQLEDNLFHTNLFHSGNARRNSASDEAHHPFFPLQVYAEAANIRNFVSKVKLASANKIIFLLRRDHGENKALNAFRV